MAEDNNNGMNLYNQIIFRSIGNEQASSAENVNEQQSILPLGIESSGDLLILEKVPTNLY